MIPEAQIDRIKEELWRTEGGARSLQVYAILDAARDDRIYPAVLDCKLAVACLYAGKLPKELLETAPYIIQLDPEAPFTRKLLEEGWGDSWGIFAASTGTLEELRRHFRKFLRVQDDTGKMLIFRWYDPRVLRVYLPTCNEGELQTLFGPVGLYLLEGEQPDVLIRYHRDESSLGQSTSSVAPPV